MNAINKGLFAKYFDVLPGRCKHGLTPATCAACLDLATSTEDVSDDLDNSFNSLVRVFPILEGHYSVLDITPVQWDAWRGPHCQTRKPDQFCPICDEAGLEVSPGVPDQQAPELSDELTEALSKIIRMTLKRFLYRDFSKEVPAEDGRMFNPSGAIGDLTGKIWLSLLTSPKFAESTNEQKCGYAYIATKNAALDFNENAFKVIPVSQLGVEDPEEDEGEPVMPWDDQTRSFPWMGSYSTPGNAAENLAKEWEAEEQHNALAVLKSQRPDDYTFILDYTQKVLENQARDANNQRVNGKQFAPAEVKRAKRIRDWLRRQVE